MEGLSEPWWLVCGCWTQKRGKGSGLCCVRWWIFLSRSLSCDDLPNAGTLNLRLQVVKLAQFCVGSPCENMQRFDGKRTEYHEETIKWFGKWARLKMYW